MKFEFDTTKDRAVITGATSVITEIVERIEATTKLKLMFLKMDMMEIEAVN